VFLLVIAAGAITNNMLTAHSTGLALQAVGIPGGGRSRSSSTPRWRSASPATRSIALFDPGDGTLFSGDVVYDDGEPLDSIAEADRGQYRASLRRLRSLPIRVVRPGHGPSLGRRRLHAIIDRYLKERP